VILPCKVEIFDFCVIRSFLAMTPYISLSDDTKIGFCCFCVPFTDGLEWKTRERRSIATYIKDKDKNFGEKRFHHVTELCSFPAYRNT
jgi:hypothetical protein